MFTQRTFWLIKVCVRITLLRVRWKQNDQQRRRWHHIGRYQFRRHPPISVRDGDAEHGLTWWTHPEDQWAACSHQAGAEPSADSAEPNWIRQVLKFLVELSGPSLSSAAKNIWSSSPLAALIVWPVLWRYSSEMTILEVSSQLIENTVQRMSLTSVLLATSVFTLTLAYLSKVLFGQQPGGREVSVYDLK